MIRTKPLNKEMSALVSSWYKGDKEGKKRIGVYQDIEKWLSLLNNKNRWSWVVFDEKTPDR